MLKIRRVTWIVSTGRVSSCCSSCRASFAEHTELERAAADDRDALPRGVRRASERRGHADRSRRPTSSTSRTPTPTTRVHLEQLDGVRLPLGAGISGSVLRSGRAELILDARHDPRYNRAIEAHPRHRRRLDPRRAAHDARRHRRAHDGRAAARRAVVHGRGSGVPREPGELRRARDRERADVRAAGRVRGGSAARGRRAAPRPRASRPLSGDHRHQRRRCASSSG